MKVDTDYYKKLGKRLAKIRDEKNLSQRKVAEAIGVTFQQYQKYESGVNRIPTNSLVIFCDLTNSDLREVAGVPIDDYEKAYKEPIVKHTYNTTYVNNFNGLFSNLFNIDLKLLKNKISVAVIILGVLLFFVIELLKMFPPLYNIHYDTFLSFQFLDFMIVFSITMFIVFGYSWLTYIVTFISYTGVYGNLHRIIFFPQTKFLHPLVDRAFMYLIAGVLVFLTFYILKKLKVNMPNNNKIRNHNIPTFYQQECCDDKK